MNILYQLVSPQFVAFGRDFLLVLGRMTVLALDSIKRLDYEHHFIEYEHDDRCV